MSQTAIASLGRSERGGGKGRWRGGGVLSNAGPRMSYLALDISQGGDLFVTDSWGQTARGEAWRELPKGL